MPSPTYVAIAKTVLTTSQSSVTISAIPSTYTDLLLVISARDSIGSVNGAIEARLNGTATTASDTYLYTFSTSSVGSSRDTGGNTIYFGRYPGSTATSNTFSNIEIYIPNYTSSTNKVASVTAVSENNSSSPIIDARANLSAVTAAVSSIVLYPSSSFVSESRFDLYGIKNS